MNAPTSQSPEPITVTLADSNPLMMSALLEFFGHDRRFSLVATVNSAESFLEAVLRVPVAVAVIDWTLPMLGGARLLEVLRAQTEAPRVVVYAQEDGEIPRRAMEAGAAAYCSRREPPERLLEIVAEVAAGRMVFPFLDVRELHRDPLQTLTAKERGLLALLAQGQTNKQLAAELSISVNTVKFHLRNVFEKLSVSNRAQAVAAYLSAMTGTARGADGPRGAGGG